MESRFAFSHHVSWCRFLPPLSKPGATGQLFVEFAVAVAGSVVISAFVALSLSRAIAARILRPIHEKKHNRVVQVFDRIIDRTTAAYRRSLVWALGHRVLIIFVGLISLGLTVVLYRGLEKEFLPEEDKGRLLCFVVAPQGSTPEYTDRMLREMEQMLLDVPEVRSFGSIVAPGFSGPGEANNGILFIRLKDDREKTVQELVNGPTGLRAKFFNNIEGALAIAQIPKAIDRSFNSAFQLVIQSQDLDALNRYVTQLSAKLRQGGYLENVRSSFEMTKPELRIDINRDRAAALGVSIEDVSRTMQILFGGLT